LAEAFDAFMGLKKFLLAEKDSPTEIGGVPSSLAEWNRMRVKKPAKRGAASRRLRPEELTISLKLTKGRKTC
jgi:hypothetical protein